jgi:predicted nuclease of predicted toxin-antitoxin system
MKFLLDESADFTLSAFLQDLGHDVTGIAHDYPKALRDSDVLAIAHGEARILITNDRDFGELVIRQRLPHSGVILFRLRNEAFTVKQARLAYVLGNYSDQLQHFIVITQNRIRIRRLPNRS